MSDYKKLFQEVSEFLTEKGYGILVEQVRDELATGRLSEEKIQTLKEVEGRSIGLLSETEFKRSQSADFVRRQDYSDAESVVLLLEASKRAIIDGTAMASQIKGALENLQIQGLTFASEEDEKDSYELPMDNIPNLAEANRRVSEIEELIRQIRNQ
ncbi:hypothetical protein MQE22_12605 [Acidithiobacillus sp. YTS05]|uniref:Uncharacterized protein n=1 Tax=Igneacidithiobacillus copahuensis TaxID=2724909 RepID=A0AAE2YPH2_9PROT|nr:hypothetical protein [Igneacidithiobacillus copahuensis]MBU2787633.1 hypothetical protein [Igneacidithiobacillus copahuensis]MBU2797656.1 hypothetical protein [Acidithiobacillus sp. VAN18-2]UTV80835.1 hypothetical protein MQE22_12605 [Acidithiobacillus sp. YTS05]